MSNVIASPLPDATPTNRGAMTAEQAAKLDAYPADPGDLPGGLIASVAPPFTVTSGELDATDATTSARGLMTRNQVIALGNAATAADIAAAISAIPDVSGSVRGFMTPALFDTLAGAQSAAQVSAIVNAAIAAIPNADASQRGFMSNGAQVLGGAKTFNDRILANGGLRGDASWLSSLGSSFVEVSEGYVRAQRGVANLYLNPAGSGEAQLFTTSNTFSGVAVGASDTSIYGNGSVRAAFKGAGSIGLEVGADVKSVSGYYRGPGTTNTHIHASDALGAHLVYDTNTYVKAGNTTVLIRADSYVEFITGFLFRNGGPFTLYATGTSGITETVRAMNTRADAGLKAFVCGTEVDLPNAGSILFQAGYGMRVAQTDAGNGTPMFRIMANGEVEMFGIGQGIVMRSPNGTRYRTTVTNAGALLTVAA